MGMKIHLGMDIQWFLLTHTRNRDYHGMFRHDDGRIMNGYESRSNLLSALSKGYRVIPMQPCDNFDFQKGCLGHPDA